MYISELTWGVSSDTESMGIVLNIAEMCIRDSRNKGRYGYRRITAALRNSGIHLNHKTVQRLMKELGLVCRVRVRKLSLIHI